jgi:predicted GNAT family acetyltransferase
MAGERLQMPGYTEVSAVCTHPDHRGNGYASDLVLAMVSTIIQKGDIPFLHVAAENAMAIRVYEKLGFRTRRILHLAVVKRGSE